VTRAFRFGASAHATGAAAEFLDQARRTEALGYDIFVLPDHFENQWFAVGPALAAVATVTSTIRIGALVYSNNFRHPALLAREAATLDVLSDGRLDLGIGAGYSLPEYDQTGIVLPPPPIRIEQLRESLAVIKGLWGSGPFTFEGEHYTITEMEGWPKPFQQPRPPIQVGGGRKAMLTFAGREADIVGIVARSLSAGGLDFAEDSDDAVAKKVRWVRDAAGDRFPELELGVLIWGVEVTTDRRSSAETIAQMWGLTGEQVLASPYFLLGSVDAIIEQVQATRERHGISYLTVFPEHVEAFAPVVSRLAGT
jgi:probable F420-dependent oxidoreductase